DPAALAAACAPGSPALRVDAVALQALARQGWTARGLRHGVRSVRQVAFDGTTARLLVRDVLAPYEVLDARGAVLDRRPARPERAFEVVLVRTGAGYRLQQVSRP
ncbi:MAG: hypothetical protein JWN17_2353, partial [Frankiales bacterium]|nr:hypothetical protein [Frankiales bacterium]